MKYHYKYTQNLPGPKVTIIGGLHGDETAGVEIIQNLKKELNRKKSHPNQIFGEIHLIIGNPKAYEQNKRFIQKDLNRLFTPSLLTPNTYEQKRAIEIAEILKDTDYLLDIHSTIKPSIPFIYCEPTPKHFELANIFSAQVTVSASPEFRPPELISSADNFVDLHGGTALTYETGWLRDLANLKEVYQNTLRFLTHTKSLKGETTQLAGEQKHLVIYQDIKPKTTTFKFAKYFKNFDTIKKDKPIATELINNTPTEIKAPESSYIIFPKIDLTPNQPACYLATTS